LRAGIDVGSVRFRVLEHFNSYARREDVDLSPTLHAGVVLSSGVGYEVMWADVRRLEARIRGLEPDRRRVGHDAHRWAADPS